MHAVHSAERIEADRVADLARSGDRSAQRAFDLATAALTEALINYVTLLGPELIVIGGGLSGASDLFVPQLVVAMATAMTFQRLPRIVTARLTAALRSRSAAWPQSQANSRLGSGWP